MSTDLSTTSENGRTKENGRTSGVGRLVDRIRSLLTVERVFSEPIERDGVTVIPAAVVRGGGGGGGGGGETVSGQESQGEGLGFGVFARPAGAFVIQDGHVRWEPALDLTRIIVAATIGVTVLGLAYRRVAKVRAKRR